MNLPLERSGIRDYTCGIWSGITRRLKTAPPYINNPRAVLIHRPRWINIYGCKRMAIRSYCGQVIHSKAKNLVKMAHQVDRNQVVCLHCENKAVEAGLPSTTQLHIHHVCVGGVKAFSQCCPEEKPM